MATERLEGNLVRKEKGQSGRAEPQVAVLVDRSRDVQAARELVGLEPDDRYHTTDSRVPLSARTLSRYDVLVIAGHALATYSRGEIDAIVRFVRRGGGLLLAASAGVFERYTGRPANATAVSAIARRFGIEFLSPSEAAGRHRPDHELVDGYPPESVRLHAVAPVRGLQRCDVCLRQWSPLRARKRRSILLSHRRTGEAAAVAIRFGKGRVAAVGEAGFLRESPVLCRRLLDHLAAGSPHRGEPRRLPYELLPPLRVRRHGDLAIHYSPAVAGRVPTVLRLAKTIAPRLHTLLPAKLRKKNAKLCIELLPGCGWHIDWWRGDPPVLELGADASDAELAFAIGRRFAEPLLWRTAVGWFLHSIVLGGIAMLHGVGVKAMRWAGFEAEAQRLADALERDSRRRFGHLDACWYYPHGIDSPGFWLWRELARRFGDDILERFIKAVPKKVDWDLAPNATFTLLDVAIHFLSKAAGTDLYPWFAERGVTVHRLPSERFGSQPFKRGVRRNLRRFLADRHLPASERFDAVEALIACQKADKWPLRHAVRQLRSREPAVRLTGAARLARVRDPRGLDTLRALTASDGDPALAAIAALFLVEAGVRPAAGRLAGLASPLDRRFQLDVGRRLEWLGDPRAAAFALDAIRRRDGRQAARMEVQYGQEILVFPTVNGQHVANISSRDRTDHMPGNTHVSSLSVHWVHTFTKFRRKGLARLAMQRTFADPRTRRCSCAWLGTGTRNNAHALYRSFGFVDVRRSQELRRDLADVPPPARAKGIRVRRYRPGDEAAMARLFNACYGDFLGAQPKRSARLWPGVAALVAYRGRRLVGYVQAEGRGEERAWIHELAVAPGKRRQEIAAALVTRLQRLLKENGAKSVAAYRAIDHLEPLLEPLGYVRRETGGVDMFKLIDLPRFLEEITSLLERRMEKTDWTGTIALRGEKHRATLAIRNGRVRVPRRLPARPDITLWGSDATITRIVAGIHTLYEPYLQLDLEITPALNQQVVQLLETLFPRVEMYG